MSLCRVNESSNSCYLLCVTGNVDVAWRGVRGVVDVWGGDVRWGRLRLSEVVRA